MVSVTATGYNSPQSAMIQTQPPNKRLTSVDLFSRPGGLTLGLDQAGFECLMAVEFSVDACKTFKSHHPDTDLRDTDIAEVDFRPLRGEVDLVAGGPPCQPFSSGGKRLAADDPRNGIPQFIRAVTEIHPRAVLMENVPGLAAGEKKEYLEDEVVAKFKALGYEVAWRVLRAADHGVPQKRRRLILVGLLDGQFAFPPATHGPGTGQPWVASGAVVSAKKIHGTPNPSTVTYAKNPSLRPDPYHGMVYNGGGRPLDLGKPAPTILASSGGNKTPWVDTKGVVVPYHRHLLKGGAPRTGRVPGARRITAEEAALLQTFPASIQFAGTRSSQYTQIGNAVPPLLAEVVGRQLAALL